MTSIFTELVQIFIMGPADGHPQEQNNLAVLKTYWRFSAVTCSIEGLLSFWHIPNFHSQLNGMGLSQKKINENRDSIAITLDVCRYTINSVLCTMVVLLSLWNIPHFHSQFYSVEIYNFLPFIWFRLHMALIFLSYINPLWLS